MQKNYTTAGQPELKLWDLNGRLKEHTEELETVENKMQAFFTHQEGNSKTGASSSEYWKQIANRVAVAEGSGPTTQSNTPNVHVDPYEREHEKQIQNQLKLMDMSPHITNSEFN